MGLVFVDRGQHIYDIGYLRNVTGDHKVEVYFTDTHWLETKISDVYSEKQDFMQILNNDGRVTER